MIELISDIISVISVSRGVVSRVGDGAIDAIIAAHSMGTDISVGVAAVLRIIILGVGISASVVLRDSGVD